MTSAVATSNLCPKCSQQVPANAPEGACPTCLVGLAVESLTSHPHGPFQPPSPEQVNETLQGQGIRVLTLIGAGGMGAVYQAVQERLDRVVALKILAPARARDVLFAERFLREARVMAKLHHPGIVDVYDSGEAGGFYYILMEFVQGATLRDLLHDGRLSAEEAMRIIPQVCDAIQYAHDQGIVHRDIKPENVLIDESGNAKVADFGVARPLTADAIGTLTDANARFGTPRYMAPEQARGKADHRSDIYALGVMFYELLTGELPLADYRRPSEQAGVDSRVDRIVERSIKASPDERYQTAGEVKRDVELVVSGPAKSRSRPVQFAVAAAAIVLLTAIFWPLRDVLRGSSATTPSQASSKPDRAVAVMNGDYGLQFDGAASWVEIPTLKRDTAGPLTIEFWTKVDPQRNPENRRMLFLTGNQACQFQHIGGGGVLVFDPNIAGDRRIRSDFGATGTRSYSHLAYVVDDREARLYVDGKLVGSAAVEIDVNRIDTRFGSSWIGGRPDSSGPMVRFLYTGRMDEIRFSSVVRYAADFTPAHRFEPDADTIALYHCDEGTGNILSDSSGHQHHGKIAGATWVEGVSSIKAARPATAPVIVATSLPTSQPAAGDLALQFDGKTSYVEIPSLKLDDDEPVTIEAWVRPVHQFTASAKAVVVLGGNGRCQITHLPTGLAGQGPRMTGHGIVAKPETAGQANPERAFHVALVRDTTTACLYVDGVLVGQTLLSSLRPPDGQDVPHSWIGGHPNRPDEPVRYNFRGFIDEIRISRGVRYSAAFTPPQRMESDDKTLALYHCDEGAGNVLYDASGNNHHGTTHDLNWMPAAIAGRSVSSPQ